MFLFLPAAGSTNVSKSGESLETRKPLTEVINKQESAGSEKLSPYALLRLKRVQENSEILKLQCNVDCK